MQGSNWVAEDISAFIRDNSDIAYILYNTFAIAPQSPVPNNFKIGFN